MLQVILFAHRLNFVSFPMAFLLLEQLCSSSTDLNTTIPIKPATTAQTNQMMYLLCVLARILLCL